MALKQTHTFFHTVEGVLHQFTVDSSTPLLHLQQVFATWMKDVGNMIDNAQAQAEATQPEVPPVPVEVPKEQVAS